MDVDEDTLDWDANDEDEGTRQRGLQAAAAANQRPIATKDEATLSGAESLLALASGGTATDVQDDKDSDVVSLGGGEDDMQELFAYQSRTNLGSTADSSTGAQSGSAADIAQERNRAKTPPVSSTSDHNAQQDSRKSRNNSPEIPRPSSKPNSQAKSQSSDPTRSPSFARLVPPTGSLALPAKPVTAPPASSVRPSHPSIMSASSMRERDLQRENRDGAKGIPGVHNRASPESEGLPLAPGWETRRSRGESQETYYYHTKTHQTTWHRNIATGIASSSSEGSANVVYVRGRGRDSAHSSERRSPVDRDPRGTDLGSQPRSRPSRFDQTEPNARMVPSPLTFDERHYRPDDNRSPPRAPPLEGGEFRQQRISGSGPAFRREPSPTSIPARPPLPHRDTDRDRLISRREQDRDRGPSDRLPPLHSNGRLIDRNGEGKTERDRSRSPGRGRIQQGPWRNNPATGRDASGSPPRERRVPIGMDGSRPFGDSPPHRGAPRAARSGSSGYDDRPRYPQPNLDQSSARDRHRSPPPPERLYKRARSISPPFSQVNRPPTTRFPLQPPRNSHTWGEPDTRQREGHYQQPQFGMRDRQRPPYLQDGSAPPVARSRESPRNTARDETRFLEGDDRTDAKRRKLFDTSDSVVTRRHIPLDGQDDRDAADGDVPRPKRAPLPPQAERFKEMASPPSSQQSLPRNPSNGVFPPSVPSGPRRGPLMRDSPPNFPPFSRPPPLALSHKNDSGEPHSRFVDAKNISEDVYDNKDRDRGKPRERDRGRDSYTDLPTGPRAMEVDADGPSRRGRSPPRHHRTDRSPPPPPRDGPRQPERWGEVVDHGGPRRLFGDSDWQKRDRQMGSRVGGNYENNRPQARESYPPNSRFGSQHPQRQTINAVPYGANGPPRRSNYLQTPPIESYPPPITDSSYRAPLPHGGQKFSGVERQNRRFPGPNSPQGGFRPLAPLETHRRRSFSSAPSNMDRNRDVPQAPRASLSPVNRTNAPSISSHPPRPRLQPSYSSNTPNLPDRPLRPEEEGTQVIWSKDDSATASRSPVPEVRHDAFSEDPNTEYDVASPPPSRSQSTAASSLHLPESQAERPGRRSRSPKPVGAKELLPRRSDDDELPKEGLGLLPKPPADRRIDEPQPNEDQLVHDGVHPDQPIVPSEIVPARRTSMAPRVRRFSKISDPPPSNSADSGPPGIREQVQQPLPRAGSLLDRLSNPVPPLRGSPAPHLRDRVGLPASDWKTAGSGSPLGLSFNSEGPPSLRDRVQPVTEARRTAWSTPTDGEWNNSGFDDGAGDWRGRRGGKPRKRGWGQ